MRCRGDRGPIDLEEGITMRRKNRLLALMCASMVTTLAHAADDRGAYLVRIMGCADCHMPFRIGPNAPPGPDFARGLSGHPQDMPMPVPPAATGPWNSGGSVTHTAYWGSWGVSYAANLTPDRGTGIGSWTEQDFANAMRTGKHVGVGRPILPPMPWRSFAAMTDDDLGAMYRYLMSQPAIVNHVPDAVITTH
jgi:hypothetical protein